MKKTLVFILAILVLLPLTVSADEITTVNQTDMNEINVTVIHFFYSSGCPHCAKLNEYLNEVKEQYGDAIEIKSHNSVISSDLFAYMQQQYGVPLELWGGVPKAFIENSSYYCIGDMPCIEGCGADKTFLCLEDVESKPGICEVLENICNGGFTPRNETAIDLTKIIGLAAVDAVNPCALAVLTILLTSILIQYPTRKSKALQAGLMFAASVFVIYFGLGLLIILGFKTVTAVTQLSSMWFYKILAVFAIVLGIFNIKDFFRYGGGGFVMEVPKRWRPRMKRFITSVTSPTGAFFVGIIVSLFLLPCTAGPYFVAGGILSNFSWFAALLPLLLYNIIFILPMIGITLIVYVGLATVGHVSVWRDRNIRLLHLVAGLIMLGLGIAMLVGLI